MCTTIGPIHNDRRPPGGRRERPLLWLRTVGCLVTLACSLLVAPCTPDAQPAKKVHRIGLLSAGSPLSSRVNIEAFQQGLRALGYVEGQNMVIEYRYAEGQAEQLPTLAAAPASPYHASRMHDLTAAAQTLGVHLHVVELRREDELDSAFAAMVQARADALLVVEDALLLSRLRRRTVDLAATHTPAAGDVRPERDCGGWRAHVLLAQPP
jgi:hypothetical protein